MRRRSWRAQQGAVVRLHYPAGMRRATLLMPGLLAALVVRPASAAPLPVLPSAGSELQQLTPVPQAAPKSAPDLPAAAAPERSPVATTDNTRIRVHALRISGNRQFDQATLVQAASFSVDHVYTLAQLRELALNITRFYRAQGYFVASAVLPAQDIVNDEVHLQVIEGQFGQTTLRNTSAVRDSTVAGLLGAVQSGQLIALAPLERALLLLNDLPGATARGTLVAGADAGTSDLLVDLASSARISGLVDLDNQGSRATGTRRAGAALTLNELAGLGDSANLRVQQAIQGLTYARGAWQAQWQQARLGAAYTDVQYRLGDTFSPLRAHGSATVDSLYAIYPLVRERERNLNLQVGWDRKTFHDQVDSTASVTDKAARVWTGTLSGGTPDRLVGSAYDTGSITWTSGRLDIRSPDALAADVQGGGTNGHYDKVGFNAVRQQWLGSVGLLNLAVSGQLSSHNLDASEKFTLGGADGVRAYPPGEANGDQAILISAEFRHPLASAWAALPGQWQAVLFADTGRSWLSRFPATSGDNQRTLSDLGMGLGWSFASEAQVRFSLAHKLGSQRATSAPDAAVRAWLQGVLFF